MLSQVRIALFIQVLSSFVNGILFILLPLLMESKNINIVTIGFLFASMPIISQFGRIAVAITSDLVGRKPFFILHGALGIISNLIYYLVSTPLGFLSGKIIEGLKSVWLRSGQDLGNISFGIMLSTLV